MNEGHFTRLSDDEVREAQRQRTFARLRVCGWRGLRTDPADGPTIWLLVDPAGRAVIVTGLAALTEAADALMAQ